MGDRRGCLVPLTACIVGSWAVVLGVAWAAVQVTAWLTR